MSAIRYSIVIPVYNESKVLGELYRQLVHVMDSLKQSYEIVFVDDGSHDDSFMVLKDIAGRDNNVVVVSHCRNFGQSAGLANGFIHARGEIIISMDGDLQHDPSEIPKFIDKINEGYDLVSGWRAKRVDNLWSRKIPSWIANWMMSKVSGIKLNDFGTTFKAYRRELLKNIELIGEMHRFIPALVSRQGAKVCEIPINNIQRPMGKSNYNIMRTFHVIFDMLTIKFLISYMDRPLHIYGSIGILFFSTGFLIAGGLAGGYYFAELIIQNHIGNLILSILLMILGVQLTAFGMIMEVVSRIYNNTSKRQIYPVRQIIRKNNRQGRGGECLPISTNNETSATAMDQQGGSKNLGNKVQ